MTSPSPAPAADSTSSPTSQLWRDRPRVTWLAVAAVQALFGLIIYRDRLHVA